MVEKQNGLPVFSHFEKMQENGQTEDHKRKQWFIECPDCSFKIEINNKERFSVNLEEERKDEEDFKLVPSRDKCYYLVDPSCYVRQKTKRLRFWSKMHEHYSEKCVEAKQNHGGDSLSDNFQNFCKKKYRSGLNAKREDGTIDYRVYREGKKSTYHKMKERTVQLQKEVGELKGEIKKLKREHIIEMQDRKIDKEVDFTLEWKMTGLSKDAIELFGTNSKTELKTKVSELQWFESELQHTFASIQESLTTAIGAAEKLCKVPVSNSNKVALLIRACLIGLKAI